MEQIKAVAVRFLENGNDITSRSKTLYKITKNIAIDDQKESEYYIYYSLNGEVWYNIDYDYNGQRLPKYVDALAKDGNLLLNSFTERYKSNCYFNKVELELAREFNMYEQCMQSRLNCIVERELKAKQEAEQEAIQRKERERQREEERKNELSEKEAERAKKELFFKNNEDILIPNLSNFQKLTAIQELSKVYRFDISHERILCSFLDLIRKYEYNNKRVFIKEYSDRKINGCYKQFEKPKRECYITSSSSSMYQIPAKLYDILNLPIWAK